MSLFIRHPMGLGDHLCCCGLVRALAEHQPVIFPVLLANLYSVDALYPDYEEPITPLIVESNAEADVVYQRHKGEKLSLLVPATDARWFDAYYYRTAGVPLNRRWSGFRAAHDAVEEKRVFDWLDPKQEYQFVHDDPSRGLRIPEGRLTPGLAIINPIRDALPSIFAYREVIKRAKVVHCMSSSFAHWIECEFTGKPDMYMHAYVRRDGTQCSWRNMKVVD